VSEVNEADLRTLSIDIGGSGCKAFVLNQQGEAVTERIRIKTPEVPTPPAVLKVLRQLAEQSGEFDRISCGFPGVVVEGEIRTAVNLHPDWVGVNLANELQSATGKPARVANDADIQGLAVIEGKGLEMVLTLGTGMGAALFINGRLVPNLELGHHPFRKNSTYEDCLGEATMKSRGLGKWNKRLAEAIDLLDRIFNYQTLYLGGGNAKKIDFELPANVKTVPNLAGLLGGIYLWRD
jgi:polyphosphate glucokinase